MHPLFGADLRTLVRLLPQNGPVAPARLPTAAAVLLAALARCPFAALEQGYVAARRRHLAPMPPPVFIIGHWRSGTTHLYNLLTRADFGFVTPFAAGLPCEFLTLGRWLRPALAAMLPRTRYVDAVEVHADSPQEDEIPLGSITPLSFYHGVYFPRHFDQHFRRSMFLEGCAAGDLQAWRNGFRWFMEKLWIDQGRRLLIKNPTYTTRIPLLRELYPDARFIHIYRNPLDVFRSTRKFYRTLLECFAWQPFDHVDVDARVLEGYRRMMEQVEIDKQRLEANRYVDIRFEDLEARPVEQITRLYRQLELGAVEPFIPGILAYLRTVRGFRKAVFADRSADRALIERHWAPIMDRLGYAVTGH